MATQPEAAIRRPPFSFYKRVIFTSKLYFLKAITFVFFRIIFLPNIRNRAIQPTFTKVYPVQPSLRHRIFYPESYKSGDVPLPLYVDVHGGGFALMGPWADDEFSSNFCNNNNVLVISLHYPLAPQHRYPKAVKAIIDVVNAILEDESLPFDRNKVAIGGSSAGANLSLAAVQDPSLQGKIGGVVPFYPPVDFTTPIKQAMATRPKEAGPDILENMGGHVQFCVLC